MKRENKPPIKSINDQHNSGDMILLKNGSEYKIGRFNGTYIQIIREIVKVPKSDIEIEFDKKLKEREEKIKQLEESELSKKSNKEVDLIAEQEKMNEYFEDFKEEFNLPEDTTIDKLFAEVETSRGAFEMYVKSKEDDKSNEYLDADEGDY
jgi:ribosomal protein L14E/L6E/L27E